MSQELEECKRILRQGGASVAELVKFEARISQTSRVNLADYARYLRLLAAAGLTAYVERLRYGWDDQYVVGPDSKPQAVCPRLWRPEIRGSTAVWSSTA